MNWKRAKAIGKLLLLFGTPTFVVLGLFSTGVYYGNHYRVGITSFEKEWLGLDIEVAPAVSGEEGSEDEDADAEPDDQADADDADDAADAKSDDHADADDAADAKPDDQADAADAKPDAQDSQDAQADAGDKTGDAPDLKPVVPPKPEAVVEPTPPPSVLPPEVAVPEMTVDPVQGALATQLATPVTIGIKVLVDDELVENHPDWIDYVQRTVSRASAVYEKQFGIELELASVGRWGVATEGLSAEDLLHDVHARSREAASIVVGFTERPFDKTTRGNALTPTEDDPFNASAAVVYAESAHRDAHVRTLLHELGHLFGALDIVDARHPDYRSGSWMSDAPVPQDRAPWIDAANRARILLRKSKPFASAPKAEQPDAPPPDAPPQDTAAADDDKGDAP